MRGFVNRPDVPPDFDPDDLMLIRSDAERAEIQRRIDDHCQNTQDWPDWLAPRPDWLE